jgi:hypothetical protein
VTTCGHHKQAQVDSGRCVCVCVCVGGGRKGCWTKPPTGSPTTSRAPNGTPRNQHTAGYRSRIFLKNVEIRTELEKRVLYAL